MEHLFYDMLAVNIIKMEQAFHCFQPISIEANQFDAL